jgi:hypothetical protein
MAGRGDGEFVACGDAGWGGRVFGGKSRGDPQSPASARVQAAFVTLSFSLALDGYDRGFVPRHRRPGRACVSGSLFLLGGRGLPRE